MIVKDGSYHMRPTLGAGCVSAQTYTEDLVGLKLWVGDVGLDALNNRHRDMVLIKGPQALQEVCLH